MQSLPTNSRETIESLTDTETGLLFGYAADHNPEIKTAILDYLALGNRLEAYETWWEFDVENGWDFIYTVEKKFHDFLRERNIRVWLDD